jgi:hypothetical protein
VIHSVRSAIAGARERRLLDAMSANSSAPFRFPTRPAISTVSTLATPPCITIEPTELIAGGIRRGSKIGSEGEKTRRASRRKVTRQNPSLWLSDTPTCGRRRRRLVTS